MVNTRGVMIGVDIVKPEVSSTHSPCWIGLNSGWGYAAKSGELFIPGSRSNHLSRPFNKGYKQGDTIGKKLFANNICLICFHFKQKEFFLILIEKQLLFLLIMSFME